MIKLGELVGGTHCKHSFRPLLDVYYVGWLVVDYKLCILIHSLLNNYLKLDVSTSIRSLRLKKLVLSSSDS